MYPSMRSVERLRTGGPPFRSDRHPERRYHIGRITRVSAPIGYRQRDSGRLDRRTGRGQTLL